MSERTPGRRRARDGHLRSAGFCVTGKPNPLPLGHIAYRAAIGRSA